MKDCQKPSCEKIRDNTIDNGEAMLSAIITGLRLTLVNQYKVEGAEDVITTTAVVTGTIWVVC